VASTPAQFGVDDRVLVGADPAGSPGVGVGLEVPSQIGAQAGVVVHAGARQHFFAAPVVQCGGAPDLAGGPQSGGEGFQIALVGVIVRVDQGRGARLGAGQPDGAATGGEHQGGGEGVALAYGGAGHRPGAQRDVHEHNLEIRHVRPWVAADQAEGLPVVVLPRGDRPGRAVDHAAHRVNEQVGPDAGKVGRQHEVIVDLVEVHRHEPRTAR